MGNRDEVVQAFAVVLGRVRQDPEALAMTMGGQWVEIGRGLERTAYYLGLTEAEQVVAVPVKAVLDQQGLPVYEQGDPDLLALAESYQPGAEIRSPHEASSVRLSEGQVSQDFGKGDPNLRRWQLENAIGGNGDKVHTDRMKAELDKLNDDQ